MEAAVIVKEVLTPTEERGEREMSKKKAVKICTVCGLPIEGADRQRGQQKTHPGECRKIHYREYSRKVRTETSAGAMNPTEEEYRSWGKTQPQPKKVKCLGHGPEHYFISPDPQRIRLCEKCRATNRRRYGRDGIGRGRHASWAAQAKGA